MHNEVCDSISQKVYFGLNIDVDLFKELKYQSGKYDLPMEYIIQDYIRSGMKENEEVDRMAMIHIKEHVMEKINIKCCLSDKTPEEVINNVLWEKFRKIEDISDDFDGDEIWDLLDHDKPEGDDILDRITDMFE